MCRRLRSAGRALPAIREGKTEERAQDHSRATYVGRRTPEDGRLDWDKPAQTLHNPVRAVSDPWPGAFAYAGANKFIVWKSRVRADLPTAKPGTVISVAPLVVACQQGALEIVTGQTERGVYMQGRPAGAGAGAGDQRGAEQQTGGGGEAPYPRADPRRQRLYR